MENVLPKLMGVTMLMLLMLSLFAATPVLAVCSPRAGECLAPPYAIPSEPVWAALNGVPQGNYPGGNMEFSTLVVNSDQPPDMNFTLLNETVTAPEFPPDSQSNYAIGLQNGLELAPGQLFVNTIALPVPSNFSQGNFTADLVVYGALWNGTASVFLKLTASTVVTLLGLPIVGTQTTTSSTSQSTQTTQTTTQSGTVSTTLFAAAVATPSIIVVLLLILLVRGRGRPKGAT